jgi:hypothetical protein
MGQTIPFRRLLGNRRWCGEYQHPRLRFNRSTYKAPPPRSLPIHALVARGLERAQHSERSSRDHSAIIQVRMPLM